MTTLNLIQIVLAASCYVIAVILCGLDSRIRKMAMNAVGAMLGIGLFLIAISPILIFFGIIDAIAKLF